MSYMSDISTCNSYFWSLILGCVCLSVLLILCLLGADWGRTYWFLGTHVSSWKSPDCFCSAPRLPLFCLAPSNETPNELTASFLSFSARSAACVISLLVSPAFALHVFVSPPPALLADFSIHPPPPFFLTVLKPFFISCFYSTLSHSHSPRLLCFSVAVFASVFHLFALKFFFLSHIWKVKMLLTCGRWIQKCRAKMFSAFCVFHDVSDILGHLKKVKIFAGWIAFFHF